MVNRNFDVEPIGENLYRAFMKKNGITYTGEGTDIISAIINLQENIKQYESKNK
jgi:hypothetical protein